MSKIINFFFHTDIKSCTQNYNVKILSLFINFISLYLIGFTIVHFIFNSFITAYVTLAFLFLIIIFCNIFITTKLYKIAADLFFILIFIYATFLCFFFKIDSSFSLIILLIPISIFYCYKSIYISSIILAALSVFIFMFGSIADPETISALLPFNNHLTFHEISAIKKITLLSCSPLFLIAPILNQFISILKPISIAKLKDDMQIDHITSFYTKKSFETFMRAENSININAFEKKYSSIFIVDVDNSKNLYNNHGNIFWENATNKITTTLKSSLRNSDKIFKYRSDTFIVILPYSSYYFALDVAEKVRKNLSEIEYENIKDPITVSIGFTYLDDDDTLLEGFERAKKALHKAKNSGKNKMELS